MELLRRHQLARSAILNIAQPGGVYGVIGPHSDEAVSLWAPNDPEVYFLDPDIDRDRKLLMSLECSALICLPGYEDWAEKRVNATGRRPSSDKRDDSLCGVHDIFGNLLSSHLWNGILDLVSAASTMIPAEKASWDLVKAHTKGDMTPDHSAQGNKFHEWHIDTVCWAANGSEVKGEGEAKQGFDSERGAWRAFYAALSTYLANHKGKELWVRRYPSLSRWTVTEGTPPGSAFADLERFSVSCRVGYKKQPNSEIFEK